MCIDCRDAREPNACEQGTRATTPSIVRHRDGNEVEHVAARARQRERCRIFRREQSDAACEFAGANARTSDSLRSTPANFAADRGAGTSTTPSARLNQPSARAAESRCDDARSDRVFMAFINFK